MAEGGNIDSEVYHQEIDKFNIIQSGLHWNTFFLEIILSRYTEPLEKKLSEIIDTLVEERKWKNT